MKLFFVDLETTGVDPLKHGVTQISGKIFIDGEMREEFDLKVRPLPGQLVSEEALTATHVTIQQLREYPDSVKQFVLLKNMLAKYVDKYKKKDKFFFVGYNAMFDNQFLRKFFENHGDEYFGSWFWHPPVCVMQLSMFALMDSRSTMENFKLGTVAETLGIIGEGRLHDATHDVDLTIQMFEWFATKASNIVTKETL